MMLRTKTTVVSTSPQSESLSSFLHGAVGFIDDNDKNDETLYRVSERWNDNLNGDNEDINWDTILTRAHGRARAARKSTPAAGQDGMLPEEVLLQELLSPQEGDKPIWWLRCHVMPPQILCTNILNNILAGL